MKSNCWRRRLHDLEEVMLRKLLAAVSIEATIDKLFEGQVVLVDEVLDCIAVVVEVQVYDEAIVEEVHDTLKYAICKELLVSLGKVLFHSVLTQPLVLSDHLEVGQKGWILAV